MIMSFGNKQENTTLHTMSIIIVESPNNVVASCGNTDSRATKAEANKAIEENNFVLKN